MTRPALPAVSLGDEARALIGHGGTTCGIATLHTSNPTLAAELDAALASGIASSGLSRALRNRGVTLSENSLNRHRRHDCACHDAR